MLERIIGQQQPLCAATIQLKKTDLMPSDNEISSMEAFLEVMKPVVRITEVIGGEAKLTISAVRPLLQKLFKHLVVNPADTTLVSQLKEAVAGDLESRYTNVVTE